MSLSAPAHGLMFEPVSHMSTSGLVCRQLMRCRSGRRASSVCAHAWLYLTRSSRLSKSGSHGVQDLFSELAAPPPQQRQALQPPPSYMQPPGYGQMGQLYGQQAGAGQGAAFQGAHAGVFPYPYAQPVPPGYQPFMLANPAAPMAPPPQQLQSFPSLGVLVTYRIQRAHRFLSRPHASSISGPCCAMCCLQCIVSM